MPGLLVPSYKQGYARYAHEVHPEARAMRESALGLWSHSLGVTGATLRDTSGRKEHAPIGAGTWGNGAMGSHITCADNGGVVGATALFRDEQPMTLFYLIRFNNFTSLNNLGGIGDSISSGSWHMRCHSGSNRRVAFAKDLAGGDIIVATATGLLTTGVWGLLTMTWDGGVSSDGVHLYWRGEETRAVFGAGGASKPATGSPTFSIMQNDTMGCNIAMFGFLDRVISVSENAILARDPDILVRKHRLQLPVSSGVAPAAAVGRMFKTSNIGNSLFDGVISA